MLVYGFYTWLHEGMLSIDHRDLMLRLHMTRAAKAFSLTMLLVYFTVVISCFHVVMDDKRCDCAGLGISLGSALDSTLAILKMCHAMVWLLDLAAKPC